MKRSFLILVYIACIFVFGCNKSRPCAQLFDVNEHNVVLEKLNCDILFTSDLDSLLMKLDFFYYSKSDTSLEGVFNYKDCQVGLNYGYHYSVLGEEENNSIYFSFLGNSLNLDVDSSDIDYSYEVSSNNVSEASFNSKRMGDIDTILNLESNNDDFIKEISISKGYWVEFIDTTGAIWTKTVQMHSSSTTNE